MIASHDLGEPRVVGRTCTPHTMRLGMSGGSYECQSAASGVTVRPERTASQTCPPPPRAFCSDPEIAAARQTEARDGVPACLGAEARLRRVAALVASVGHVVERGRIGVLRRDKA